MRSDAVVNALCPCCVGLWMARCAHSPLLVLDVEGTDSKERGDDHKVYAQSGLRQ